MRTYWHQDDHNDERCIEHDAVALENVRELLRGRDNLDFLEAFSTIDYDSLFVARIMKERILNFALAYREVGKQMVDATEECLICGKEFTRKVQFSTMAYGIAHTGGRLAKFCPPCRTEFQRRRITQTHVRQRERKWSDRLAQMARLAEEVPDGRP